MNQRKMITGVLILLILIVTGWLFLSVFKNAKKSGDSNSPANEKTFVAKKEMIKSENEEVYEGQVKAISAKSLTLDTESGEQTISLEAGAVQAYIRDEEGAPAETKVSELKTGTEAIVLYTKTEEKEMLIATGANQSIITDVTGDKITFETGGQAKTATVTPETTIYTVEGGSDVNKALSDLRPGSVVTVIYADEKESSQALGIRIDKF